MSFLNNFIRIVEKCKLLWHLYKVCMYHNFKIITKLETKNNKCFHKTRDIITKFGKKKFTIITHTYSINISFYCLIFNQSGNVIKLLTSLNSFTVRKQCHYLANYLLMRKKLLELLIINCDCGEIISAC